MMVTILHIILIALLGIAFFQDWKFRAISWMVFPALFITASILFFYSHLQLKTVLLNLVFLTIVLLSLFLYISLKRGKWTNIFKSDFGLGDVLFLIAITPLFVDRNYILFFIIGMLFSGLIHFFVHAKNGNKKIPLAGYLSLLLIGLKTVSYFIFPNTFGIDLFYIPIL